MKFKTALVSIPLTATILSSVCSQTSAQLLNQQASLTPKPSGIQNNITQNSNITLSQILIEQEADVNVQDAGDVGTTALIYAAAGGYLELVRLLLAYGADVTTQTFYGDTALTIAEKNGHFQIVEIIKRANTRLEENSFKVSQNTNPPTFDDYPVKTIPFTGNHSPIDFDSHPDAYTFRDALNYGIRYGPNFAQHYTIVTWGCGTICEAFAIVDAYTGAVYFPEFVSSVGLDFRLDSNLLIVDPPENIQSTTVPPGIETEYFIWKDQQLLPIE